MAQIVLGLGTSHSPQLSTPPELWSQHGERDKRNPDLRRPDGRVYSFAELLATTDASISKELTATTWQTRHTACQQGLAALARQLEDTGAGYPHHDWR